MSRIIRPAAERLVQYYNVGSSDGREEALPRRRVGTNVVPNASGGVSGWTRMLTTITSPFKSPQAVYDWGCRRLHLHNPFGTRPSGWMRLDQYLEALNGWTHAGVSYGAASVLTTDFVETWQPVIEGTSGGLGDPVEVCAYVGALNVTNQSDLTATPPLDYGNERFKDLYDAEDFAGLVAAINGSLAPMMEAGMTIGLDASVDAPDDGYEFDFSEKLRDGEWHEDWGPTRVYVESRPRSAAPRWAEFDVLIADSFLHDPAKGCLEPGNNAALSSWWHRSNPDSGCLTPPFGVSNSALLGERVRLMLQEGNSNVSLEQLVARTRRMLLQGDTVLMNLRRFIDNEVSFASLIEGVDEYIGDKGPMPDETQPLYYTRNAARQSTIDSGGIVIGTP